nr:unnamed protein product [Spirometra erinaceieuropaei]
MHYQLLVVVQFVFIIYDIFANSIADHIGSLNVRLLVVYILQDLIVVFAVIVIALQLFNTYLFQAGFMRLLFTQLRGTFLVVFIYFALCVAAHSWGLILRWNNTKQLVSNPGYLALVAGQRTWSIVYYHFFKRTIYFLGDRKLYCDGVWIRSKLESKN